MKPIGIIDAAFLTVSPPCVSAADFLRCVENIIETGKIVTNNIHPFEITYCFNTIENLVSESFYPTRDYVNSLLLKLGLSSVLSSLDVSDAINNIITRARQLENFADVRFVLFDSYLSDSREYRPDTCVSHMEDAKFLSALLATNAQHNPVFGSHCAIISPCVRSDSLDVKIEFTLHDVSSETYLLSSSNRISMSIKYINDIKYFWKIVDAFEVFKNADSCSHIKCALELGRKKFNSINEGQELSFFVGEQFLDSLSRNNASGDGNFAEATFKLCVRLISGMDSDKLEDFRSSKKKNSSARTRKSDGATALRVHLTGTKVGLRLMIWRRTDATLEFANIGPKNELLIEDGDPDEAV